MRLRFVVIDQTSKRSSEEKFGKRPDSRGRSAGCKIGGGTLHVSSGLLQSENRAKGPFRANLIFAVQGDFLQYEGI